MKPDEIKEWLEPEEWKAYGGCLQYERHYNSTYHRPASLQSLKTRKHNAEKNRRIKDALESLALSRQQDAEKKRLMKKHEWTGLLSDICLECRHLKFEGHAPDCLWAKAIEGGE